MSGIETAAVIIFQVAIVSATLNFFPRLRPKENALPQKLWDFATNLYLSGSLVILGLILLFLWG